MIESVYWKTKLLDQARHIRAQQHCRRWTEKRVVLLERDIMVACFCIRTLIERQKITDAVASSSVPVVAFSIRPGQRATLLNCGALDELYDLDVPSNRTVTLGFLMNQVIHSYVMFVVRGPHQRNKFERVLVCSDYERNRQLFEVEIKHLLTAMKKVAASYPAKAVFRFDEKIQDYRITATDG